MPACIKVSIHAPHVGRDPAAMILKSLCACFNPRAPRGARLIVGYELTLTESFNPRAPRGARPFDHLFAARPMGFNPRAPRGARR